MTALLNRALHTSPLDACIILYVHRGSGQAGRQETVQETEEEGSSAAAEGKEDAFITVRDAAAIIGVTPRAVRQRIEDGRLRATMIEGRYYVTRDALHPDASAADAAFLPQKSPGRKRVPSFRPTPTPSLPSSAPAMAESAITALSDEITFLRSQLVERETTLRAEMTDRETFLRAQLATREREISELHVLLQSTQRLLPSVSGQDTEERHEEPNATHKGVERGHRGFWQRLFSSGSV